MTVARQTAAGVLLPALDLGAEREDPAPKFLDWLDQWLVGVTSPLRERARLRRMYRALPRIEVLGRDYAGITEAELVERVAAFRRVMRRGGLTQANIERCFAIVREISWRKLGLRHHNVQLLGGLAMLDGRVAEMATGEGKTITAGLAASAAALAGTPVHVITVNDYLAARDLATLKPVYDFLGLTTGLIQSGDRAGRPQVYASDIVYASNKEVAFDYLRDRMALGQKTGLLHRKLSGFGQVGNESSQTVMRGLHMAIVDEADSALVDEARTPLIISEESNSVDERDWAEKTFRLIEDLQQDVDYVLLPDRRRIDLTEAGKDRLWTRAEAADGFWRNRIRREESARQALSALLLFRRGEHYLVADETVQIVDEFTGRIMADRTWSDGLHQLIEFKEGCKVTPRKRTAARMTYQRFFRRYLRLAGMSGTAYEVKGELGAVYGLSVLAVPTHVPPRRAKLAPIVCATREEKWKRIVQEVETMRTLGRPVLIGTRSVSASQELSLCLDRARIEHAVLNAEQSADEANVIAGAGRVGTVTVATNMAGRGVDVKVDPEALAMGGLHVVLSERHDARRIDRQMEGRTARKGDRGSTRDILSLEDPILDLAPPRLVEWAGRRQGWFRRRAALVLFRVAQMRAERAHASERKDLLDQDRRLGVLLAFSGKSE